MKLIFLFILLANNTFAQDCGDVKDGTVNRLDAPGKSLENARVQDQDGLGTCYANTASLLLQSAMPNHPEVSYLQLAINKAQKNDVQDLKRQGKRQAFKDNGDLLLEAGFVCQAINTAKTSGGVCERKNVGLEQMMFNSSLDQYLDPNWIQMNLLKKVSNYYDGMLKSFGDGDSDGENEKVSHTDAVPKSTVDTSPKGIFGWLFGNADDKSKDKHADAVNKDNKINNVLNDNNDKFAKYKAALKAVVDQNREEYAKKTCLKLDRTNIEKVSSNVFFRLKNALNDPNTNPNDKNHSIEVMQYLGNEMISTTGGVQTSFVEFKEAFATNLNKNYLDVLSNNKNPNSATEVFKEALHKSAPNVPSKTIDNIISDLNPDDLNLLNSDFKRYAKKDFSECAVQGRIDYMKNEDGLVNDFAGIGCSNDFMMHVKNLRELVVGLDKYNFDNIDRINDFISNLPNLSYDQAMMKLLAPTCTDDKKIKIPRDLTCDTKSISVPGYVKEHPEKEEKYLVDTRKDFFDSAMKSFNGNKAIGLSMCTSFWDNSESGSWYNKTGVCDPTKKHGFHAVTMMGFKCDKGKKKYLIQNSWGAWDSAAPKFEKDSHGKAWMDEDDLIKNVYQMDMFN